MIIENIVVDNLKCGGCANTIKNSLTQMRGVKSVSIDVDNSRISVTHSELMTKDGLAQKLEKLGYPEEGTSNTYQKVKSYVSCAIGKVNVDKE